MAPLIQPRLKPPHDKPISLPASGAVLTRLMMLGGDRVKVGLRPPANPPAAPGLIEISSALSLAVSEVFGAVRHCKSSHSHPAPYGDWTNEIGFIAHEVAFDALHAAATMRAARSVVA